MSAPLWNSRLFIVAEKSVTCKFLIHRNVLRVSDLVGSEAWTAKVPGQWQGSRKLQPHQYQALLAPVLRVIPAWEGRLRLEDPPPLAYG